MSEAFYVAISWIVVSSCVSTALLGCQGLASHVYRACIDIAWRRLASSFTLRAEDFAKNESVIVLARILVECGLSTGYVMSRHEANALADDAMLYGTLSLPCHSFMLQCLSALQFTHYIWIGRGADSCHVVGPIAVIKALKNSANIG